jgi:hypothetical protein
MFCISQTDINLNEKIIKLLDLEKDFLEIVKGLIQIDIQVSMIESLTPFDIYSNNCFKPGYYLLINDKQIKLIHKYETIKKGYFYSSKSVDITTLNTWKLLPFDCAQQNAHMYDYSSEFELSETEHEVYNNNSLKYNNLEFQEFTLSKEYSSICIIGKRGSGKTLVVQNIIDNLNVSDKFIENTLIIDPTEQYSKSYGPKYQKAQIHFNYNSTILEEYLAKIKSLSSDDFAKFSGCVVLDSCLASKSTWTKDRSIFELLFNCKHYHLTLIMTMQFPMAITPEIRSNFNSVFLLNDDFVLNQKKIYEHYGSIFTSFEMFKNSFAQLTKDYGCMVITRKPHTLHVTDNVFYFKAKAL